MRRGRKHNHRKEQPRLSLITKLLICIGLLTVVYLFITEVLMRVLALLTH